MSTATNRTGARRVVTTWRHHKCLLRHRNTATWIKCAIGPRRVLWVSGHGSYAVISWCGDPNDVTVVLHTSLTEALAAAKQIDRVACGRRCTGWHEVVEVVL